MHHHLPHLSPTYPLSGRREVRLDEMTVQRLSWTILFSPSILWDFSYNNESRMFRNHQFVLPAR